MSLTQRGASRINNVSVPSFNDKKWVIPFVDQPLRFWEDLKRDFGDHIKEVYFPLSNDIIGSGRPHQPQQHLKRLLSSALFPFAVLINPIILKQPVNEISPKIIKELYRMDLKIGLAGITITDFRLAALIKKDMPHIPLTASVLMDISRSNQTINIDKVFNTIVPSSRIMRNLTALKKLRSAFSGQIRLMVNEACLPGCLFRNQHFYEMGSGFSHPQSLCHEILAQNPWMRLTGAWVLPQHLHYYKGLYDELKLAGRVTLNNPLIYRKVLGAYIHDFPLNPNEIGGGPASLLQPIHISESFFKKTLYCKQECHGCEICEKYYYEAQKKVKVSETAYIEPSDREYPDKTSSP